MSQYAYSGFIVLCGGILVLILLCGGIWTFSVCVIIACEGCTFSLLDFICLIKSSEKENYDTLLEWLRNHGLLVRGGLPIVRP